MVFPNRGEFYSTYRHQDFAFRDSIMHYIAKNPKSVKLYQKLVKSCKYFFLKNPILSLYELRNTIFGWGAMAEAEDGWTSLDINNVTSKFWITEGFYGFTDGSLVPLEKVVEALPKAKTIRYWCTPTSPTSVTGKTFKELIKIPHFMTLDSFMLWIVPEEFDLESFYIYMKKNVRTEVRLKFGLPLSDGYKIRLNSIVDEIIATQNHDYSVPWIGFDGMDEEKIDQLESVVFED
uniref:Uncharacterized protein n=1 Tax=Panagrolaimus davidi TaxID=227884 RepID=A0A914Q2V4_9BILA